LVKYPTAGACSCGEKSLYPVSQASGPSGNDAESAGIIRRPGASGQRTHALSS
ncbi:uncharacterized, partial [Tachysurus ichikawai]